MQHLTTITLEDGRTFSPVVRQDPARHGLWFVAPRDVARPGDRPETGPWASEAAAREFLFGTVERELGRIATVRRELLPAGADELPRPAP